MRFQPDRRIRGLDVIPPDCRAAVNILARGQEDISSYFAGAWKQPEPPPLSFETWGAVPRLAGCAGVRVPDHWKSL